MKVENRQEKITNAFINKVDTLLQSLNLTCNYNIIENEDGTRYAVFKYKECPSTIIMENAKNYGLDSMIDDEEFYLVEALP